MWWRIGSSTGGVEALITVLSAFPANCPPTVITQHMPATFTKSFAARLDKLCAPSVKEAEDGEPAARPHLPRPRRRWPIWRFHAGPRCAAGSGRADTVSGHRPSVDVLFDSVARLDQQAVGVILTGMGRDGAQGLLAMRQAGARTLGQDESSSVVYGMPRAAFELGAVERQLPLGRIGPAILDLVSAASPAASQPAEVQ